MPVRTLVVVVTLVATAAGASAQTAGPAGEQRIVTELQVPGGVARLLRTAGVPGLTDPAVAIPAFIRAVHVLPPKPRTDLPALLDQAFGPTDSKSAAQRQAGDDTVPLPLTPDWWSSVVLKQHPAPDKLAAAILGDRRAALIYVGLVSLDDETLAYFLAHSEAIATMSLRAAGAFAQWGRSVHIEGGRVLVPGGDPAATTWQEIVGERPSEPTAFIRALLSRDGGRAAYFYDALTHLDRERQAFALGVARGSARVDRAKALYSTVASTKTFIAENDWPVVRHPFGPAAILRQVKVDGEGRMKPPAGQALWEAAIADDAGGCTRAPRGGGSIDAAQLIERIEQQPLESRGHWVAAITFAQRVFPGAAAADLPAACEVINAFPRSDGLLLALERIGFERPADYVSVLRFAERAWSGVDRRAAVVRTAQIQGILQILERAVSTRSLSAERGRELVLSLTTLPAADALPGGAAGLWLRKNLLARSCSSESSADACVVHLVSGEGWPGGNARVVDWEDDHYRVNLGAATAVNLERVRRVQKASRIDEALDILEAATIAGQRQPSPADLERATTIVKALSPALTLAGPTLFGHPLPPIRSTLDGALPGLAATRTDAQRTSAATALVNAADFLLADALVSFAYAMAIGDPDDAVLMGGNPSRGHLFDGTLGPATPPWHLPEEVQALDRSWLVEGSVLMLRTIYGKSWLRRLSIHDPGAAVRPDPQDVRVFGETVTAFSAFDLTDQGRDAIVEAIHRGRDRVAALTAAPTEFWKVAREAGLGEWRCRAALWAAARPPVGRAAVLDPAGYFSLAELMWLGGPEASPSVIDAWGVATRTIDGGVSVRMPQTSTWEDYQGPRGVGQLATQVADVHLAVAEALADLKLPAALAPDVAAQAVWDVMAAARMAHRDDWYALVRAAQSIPRDRFLDYVSALTAIGPLVPVKQ